MHESSIGVAELVDDHAQFYAPASTDRVDELVGQYSAMRRKIENVAALFGGDREGVVHYFIEGNRRCDNSRYSSISAEKIFELEGGIAALNASYWQRALTLTDVYDYMPQKRRDAWNEQIRNMTTPDFEETSVRATLTDLLNSRATFFAERVDGIFQSLSRSHVTNRPEGFGKRMIISGMYYDTGSINSSISGRLNDLRCVIARFMGRDEPKHDATGPVLEAAKRRSGMWMTVDGGALKIRVYQKGTAHVEVHPDMAWRLNSVLASLHPLAIPSEFRSKPKKQPKQHDLILRPLSFAVVSLLSSLREFRYRLEQDFPERYVTMPNALTSLSYGQYSQVQPHEIAEVNRVLESVGGVIMKHKNANYWQFDFNPEEVLQDIIASGCLPDQKTHQFYPTLKPMAERAIEAAEIESGMELLEPQAGTGGIAKYMDKGSTCCVEISALHCKVLQSMGFADTVCADFLQWAETTPRRFDRVVMNPPFSDGRALAHTVAAASLVRAGGRLVAILPSSMKGNDILPGWKLEWSKTYENEFAGTNVRVVMLTAVKL